MSLQVFETNIPDVRILKPSVFRDDRGFFFESFNQKLFNQAIGQEIKFVQDNHTKSKKGVLRGLHYQTEHTQGKLVRVVSGSVFDVVVDLRKSSKTYGAWLGIELSAENKKQLWIPKGFAHGYLVLSDEAELLYKTTDYYHPVSEHSILWNDSDLNIQWPKIGVPYQLADKDLECHSWLQAPKFT